MPYDRPVRRRSIAVTRSAISWARPLRDWRTGDAGRTSGDRGGIRHVSVRFTGNIADRTLKADDIAGSPTSIARTTSRIETGSISGGSPERQWRAGRTYCRLQPTGTLIGGFSLNSAGDFVIPLDSSQDRRSCGPGLNDSDLTSFFNADFDVDVDFQ
jgi:hypothetical protein